ncbi:hypothetical protein C0J52_22127, partial [Blattella germanica]
SGNRVLFCGACEKTIGSEKRFQIVQHINTAKQPVQKQLLECLGSKVSEFSYDLCQAFLSADIPLHKINNPTLKYFLAKYTRQHVPEETTLRKTYVGRCYNNVLSKLQIELADQFVWLSIDETTDYEGRFIANIILGALNKEQKTIPYLLNVCELPAANNVTVTQCVMDSLKLLWPFGIKYDQLLLFVTDEGSYMVKSGQTGSWLDAALYYAQHIEIVKEVVNLLDSNEAASIQTVQDIRSGTELEENLVFISAHFSFLPTAITSLETVGSPLKESLAFFEKKNYIQSKFCSW